MASSNFSLLEGANHFISLDKAREMTTRYRADKEEILMPDYRNQNILLICETFNRAAFDSLLAQQGCEGIRIYFGMEPDLKVKVIAVGVNNQNEDMIPASGEASILETDGGEIVEQGQPCPFYCPPPSPLNS